MHCRDEKAGLAVLLEEVTPRKPCLGTDSDRRHKVEVCGRLVSRGERGLSTNTFKRDLDKQGRASEIETLLDEE